MIKNRQSNPYHLVENSIWPITTSFSILSFVLGLVLLMQQKTFNTVLGVISGETLAILGLTSILISSFYWWTDITKEATYQGLHTKEVINGLNIGYYLFILSEILIFATLFFAFYYNSLIPSVELGATFLPKGIIALDFKAVPLLNTALLFFSGISITASQNYLLNSKKSKTKNYLIITLILALIFTYFQYYEYTNALFTISDSVYGSSFYAITGLHSIHMNIAEIFVIVVLFKLYLNHFISNHSLGFSFCSLYWHLVDYVWLFVYSILYVWTSNF